jgi:hypothetical protein
MAPAAVPFRFRLDIRRSTHQSEGMKKAILIVASVVTAATACDRGVPKGEAAPQPTTVKHVVDSVLPMDVAMDRFRAGLARPMALRGTITSRDALVDEVMRAIEQSDTLAFERIAVNRAEWVWLYYPDDKLSKPPYELPPNLAWFQLQETNRKGVLRALRELGGHRIDVKGYTCDVQPTVEGENTVWTGCRVTLSRDGGEEVTIRLFGAILERGGIFEVLSYDNDF